MERAGRALDGEGADWMKELGNLAIGELSNWKSAARVFNSPIAQLPNYSIRVGAS
jgi:hypothetical protein